MQVGILPLPSDPAASAASNLGFACRRAEVIEVCGRNRRPVRSKCLAVRFRHQGEKPVDLLAAKWAAKAHVLADADALAAASKAAAVRSILQPEGRLQRAVEAIAPRIRDEVIGRVGVSGCAQQSPADSIPAKPREPQSCSIPGGRVRNRWRGACAECSASLCHSACQF